MHSVKQFILGPEHEFLAVSRGIEKMDLSEIRQWSAERDELLSSAPLAHSWNFHPLPTGKFCLSRTSRLALLFPHENSGKVFTHGILVPPELLKDYSNNAVTLLRHLEKQGLWRAGIEVTRQLQEMGSPDHLKDENFPHAEILPVLRTLMMDGGSEAVRLEALNAFARTTGIRRFSSILDQILGNFTTILTGTAVPEMLLEALLDVLPVGCRPEFSFSTGLKFSSKRLFRIICIGSASHEQERIRHHFNLPMISSTSVSLMQDQLLPSLKNRWSMFVATLFEQNLETAWSEIALLDETSSPGELPRRARFWFRRLGLDEIYQKIRENRKNAPWNSENYGIFQTRVSDRKEALGLMSSLMPASEDSASAPAEDESPIAEAARISPGFDAPSAPGREENVPQAAVQCYLATLTDAMHGNPLAQEQIKDVFQEITAAAPAADRQEVSEVLLREGVRSWNEEHGSALNLSWRQVEEMVDTLSTVLNLLGEGEARLG